MRTPAEPPDPDADAAPDQRLDERTPDPAADPPDADAAPLDKRTRDQLDRMADALDAIDALLHRLALQGLQRMSRQSADELQALAQTAHSAGLITIERDLARLTTHLGRALDRDPLFDPAAFADAHNRIWLVARAARARLARGEGPAAMTDLIGLARRAYEPHPALEVQALGADGWVSDSGFVGVTVWYAAGDRLLQAAAARPTLYFGTDPTRLLHFPPHDTYTHSLADLAHGAWRFDAVKLSADARLSMHKDLVIEPAPWRGARAWEPWHARRWRDAVERLRAAELHPLGATDPVAVYIEPAAIAPVVTDDKRNRATARATDATGATLDISVPLRRENNLLVDNLERLFGPRRQDADLPPCDGLFGRLDVDADRLVLHPITGVWRRPLRLPRRRGLHHTAHLSLESLEGARLA
ncbi:MAG: hypothetical protein H6705_00280 [Myxococcales bacterium]|nr:hypothetical protein [Myxococcales bacterium]